MKAVSIDNKKISQPSSIMIDTWAKKLVFKWLDQFNEGSLVIEDGGEYHHFGQTVQETSITARIIVHHDSVYRDILFNGTVGAGEAYMRGSWSSPNLVDVVRIMCQNMELVNQINSGWSNLNKTLAAWFHRFRANNKKNAKLNIAAHYDLGNDFFSLFLDPTMMYSSAIYPNETTSLDEAAIYKLDHICRQLQLNERDHLLEIGTGWGGMAIYAAKHYGCRVTTTTISKEQYSHAVEQVAAAGLNDKVTVLLDDYRDLQCGPDGKFDKLVSIEMIEAVGPQYYPEYFSTCSQLLKKDGLMLIQSITMPDQRYELTSEQADFIQQYIFPGGHLPCPSILTEHIAKNTDMQVVGIEDITLDYAKTLQDWRERFLENLAVVKSMGYDEVFIRMWDFYLSYCEGGFRERTIGTLQILMAKPRCLQLPQVV